MNKNVKLKTYCTLKENTEEERLLQKQKEDHVKYVRDLKKKRDKLTRQVRLFDVATVVVGLVTILLQLGLARYLHQRMFVIPGVSNMIISLSILGNFNFGSLDIFSLAAFVIFVALYIRRYYLVKALKETEIQYQGAKMSTL